MKKIRIFRYRPGPGGSGGGGVQEQKVIEWDDDVSVPHTAVEVDKHVAVSEDWSPVTDATVPKAEEV